MILAENNSERMPHGVMIDNGPACWQIVQQKEGYGEIRLSGSWKPYGEPDTCIVYGRIVKEDTGEPVINWTECDCTDGGRWSKVFNNIPAGGLYRLETCLKQNDESIQWAKRGDMLHHVGVGDLFVIAGQSNSSGYGRDPVSDPPEIGIHLLRNNGKWDLASHPMNESTGTVHPVNMETANPGHSPYLSFAKTIKKELGYPIGLLQTSLGGSVLSMWNPEEGAALYKNMLNTIREQGGMIKGVLWYQGCGDTTISLAETYLERFESMVRHLREDLCDPSLPFLTVQLNRDIRTASSNSNRGWGMVREAQRQAARHISNVFVVPSVDMGVCDQIHNSSASNMVIGERIARTALKEIYGRNCICKAPELSKAESTEPCRVRLEFENISLKLDFKVMDVKQLPFSIEDEEGAADIAEYVQDGGNTVILKLQRDIKGKAFIHGAHEQNPKAFIPMDTGTHLPILAFYGIEILRI